MDLNKLKELIDGAIQNVGGDAKVRFYLEDDTFRDFQSIGMAAHEVVLSNLYPGELFDRLFVKPAKPDDMIDAEQLQSMLNKDA